MPDALDLDHSYCARCETYIWPEKRQVEVQVPAKPAPAPKGRKQDEAATVTKIRTVISLDRAPLYCSERCRQSDLESGSANARRIMEHFQPSPTSTCASPVSPSQSRCNSDYFSRIAGGSLPWARRPSTTSTRSTTSMSSIELLEEHRQWSRQLLAESADRLSRSSSRAAISAEETTLPKPKPKPEIKPRDDDETPVAIPFTHRRWKEQTPRPTAERSVEVDVAALYDSYPMSQRCPPGFDDRLHRLGHGLDSHHQLPWFDSSPVCGPVCRIHTRSARPHVMLRQECDSPVYSASDDGEEPDSYFPISRNRTITQRTHTHSRSVSSPKAKKPKSDRSQKTIQDLVREAGGPEYESRPVSRSLIEREHRHVVQEVDVDGKTELRIVEEECWEEPQKLFHFMI
ncbi:Ecl1 domain protein [Ceratobasidium sp. AG-Ba]|nr:Ecl1 domain protein [Ceratobasidium sp. AG-Ba]